MSFGSFRKCIWARKKIKFFRDIFDVPAKSMRISPRFFFILEKYEKSQSALRFQFKPDFRVSCRILLIPECDEAEFQNFRKSRKNRDFCYYGPLICSRSHFRPGKFLAHFWAVEHIRPPYDSKSHFSKKTRKVRN